MHILFFALTALVSTTLLVHGSPLPPSILQSRSAKPKTHILTQGTEGCTPAQVAHIKAGIVDAKNLADVALRVLKGKDITKSNGFFHLFGGSSHTTAAEVSKRFGFVKNIEVPDEVTSTDPFKNSATDLTFTCIPPTDPKAGKANANVAVIGHKTKEQDEVPDVNLMRFGPNGLSNTGLFAAAAAAHRESGLRSVFPFVEEIPQPFLAFTIIHEVQHCDPLHGGDTTAHLKDQKIFDFDTDEKKPATGLPEVQSLDQSLKKLNPQNYAWFGLFAASKPEWFTSFCPIRPDQPLFRRGLLAAKPAKPVAVKPVAAKPPAKPVAVKPVAAKPVAAKPLAKPVAAKAPAKPVTAKPVAAKPVAAKPPAKPVAAKPVAAKPVAAKPPAKPVAVKPVAVKPVAAKPIAAKPVAAKPPAKPVAVKPVAAKPVAVAAKPVAAKPVAANPVAPKPIAQPSASATCTGTSCQTCASIQNQGSLPGDIPGLLPADLDDLD
ncbi:hypothetical protein DFH06DRAFT_1465678 [Mycena polygramma]|nr:hypothetical protein DFH06DRAFT_1465678 [Mycena polygramma]